MDKNAIKKYAIWARRELIARVSQRAALYEITAEGYGDMDAVSAHGRILSLEEKNQRRALIEKIKEKGYEQVMEEVAYTWFNRFSALRFMEVNGYLPTHVRVFTDDENTFNPQIMTEAINLEMDGLDMQKVYAFKTANDDDGLFKYLIITQCNALSDILPGMFQKISDYTELLFPDNLLREGSVVEQMISMIPEEDWTDQVQIIGWLYQYYNTEPKDRVFANLKKNIKISKENIPAATQLFTPDWIVHYMVENSLGRLWLEGHPNGSLKSKWKYYVNEVEQNVEVHTQMDTIRKEYEALNPEEIRVIDPCMGSGHILCVLFDTLVQIYEEYGYTVREAVIKILESNLWGLDIDERATQLSYFAVMMKARQYDRRFFTRNVQPHIYVIEDSNDINSYSLHIMEQNLKQDEYQKALQQAISLVKELQNAKEYGSIINVTQCDWELLRKFVSTREEGEQLHLNINEDIKSAERLRQLINIGEALSKKYHVVVTNPPYMGASGMAATLNEFIKRNYPDSKNDMSTVFMEKTLDFCKKNGYVAMINIPVWMFLTSYEKLRIKLLNQTTITSMVHPGRGIFGADFGTTTFVLLNNKIQNYIGSYRRLFDAQVEVKTPDQREEQFLKAKGEYAASQDNYFKIPGKPIAYWVSEAVYTVFSTSPNLSSRAPTKMGLTTGDNNLFLKLWYEVPNWKIGEKFHFYNKGGEFRRWFGNISYVINWENDGFAVRNYKGSTIRNDEYYFKKCISWGLITSSISSFRSTGDYSCVFGDAGPGCFPSSEEFYYILAFLNSKPTNLFLSIMNPTINLSSGVTALLPYKVDKKLMPIINKLAAQNEELTRTDWDSFETSWGFTRHPLCRNVNTIEKAFEKWQVECQDRFEQLKSNEELINQLFISIYSLQNELKPQIDNKEVSVRLADLQRDIKSFISYAVGCMFGRYSLDQPGLILAGQDFKERFVRASIPLSGTSFSGSTTLVLGKSACYIKHSENDIVCCTFEPDEDGIIPICDDEYFNDDIVGRFVNFVEVVYGKEKMEENLKFIADALGGNGTSREVIRKYFINDFYADHCSMYSVTSSGKRPIYWLFDSGKKNGFKCLVYMHRYQPDTIARIRTDYVHEQQSRYRTAIADLQSRIDNAVSTSERVKLSKKLKTVQEQDEELRIYEEKIHHLADQMIKIDLDDGVKVNYAKFQDVLTKIK